MTAKSHVLMFEQQFVQPVERGHKLHTIRPPRERTILPGDRLRFRRWKEKPYRSPQIEFATATCATIQTIRLTESQHRGAIWRTIEINGVIVGDEERRILAERDGFSGCDEMLDWHREHYGLGRDLVLIAWEEETLRSMFCSGPKA